MIDNPVRRIFGYCLPTGLIFVFINWLHIYNNIANYIQFIEGTIFSKDIIIRLLVAFGSSRIKHTKSPLFQFMIDNNNY